MTYKCRCWPWPPGWDSVCQVFPPSGYIFPPLYTAYFGRNYMHSPTCMNYLELFWNLSLLPHLLSYSIIYLCQYGLIAIYFILWVLIHYFFILLKLFQRWLFQLAPALLWWTSINFVSEHILTIRRYKMLHTHFGYLLPQTPSQFSLESPLVLFIEEWCYKPRSRWYSWVIDYLLSQQENVCE